MKDHEKRKYSKGNRVSSNNKPKSNQTKYAKVKIDKTLSASVYISEMWYLNYLHRSDCFPHLYIHDASIFFRCYTHGSVNKRSD